MRKKGEKVIILKKKSLYTLFFYFLIEIIFPLYKKKKEP